MKVRIGLYDWDVLFVPKDEIRGMDGQCKCSEFKILIREDLKECRKLTIIHEIVHALLDTQGRCFQKKFDLEDVCELIAWRLPEINSVLERLGYEA